MQSWFFLLSGYSGKEIILVKDFSFSSGYTIFQKKYYTNITMKILIDFFRIPLQKTGVGTYAFNLVSKLYEIDKKNEYIIIVQDDDACLDFIQNNHFKIIKVKSKFFRSPFLMIVLEQIYIPYLTLKYKIDIIHSLHHSFPIFAKAKKIVIVHDVTFFKCPEHHMFNRLIFYVFFDFLASIFADKIITDSMSSFNDFLHLFRYARNKACVIYLAKSDLFNPNLERTKIEEIKEKYAINKEYLLFLGTLEPRKNIKTLILAFYKLLQEDERYNLVIAGRKGWYYNQILQLPQKLGLTKKIIFTDFVDEKDKPYLIAGCKIFIYPSIYEGFGIPVLEALACGIPTITSNVSSMPEVGGDAAILIDPLNVDQLYLSIKKLLSDDILYARLKHQSIEQAKKFSWEETALQTLQVYNLLT